MAGTTALVCLIAKEEVYIANAGDSRAVGCSRIGKSVLNEGKGGKGKIRNLSNDHKPSD